MNINLDLMGEIKKTDHSMSLTTKNQIGSALELESKV